MSIFNLASAADLAAETSRAQKAEAALAAKVSADETTLAGLVKAVAALQAAGATPPVTTPPVTTPPVTTPPVTTPPVVTPPVTTPPVSGGNTGQNAGNTGVPASTTLTKVDKLTVPAGQSVTGYDVAGQLTLGKGAKFTNGKVRGVGLGNGDFLVLAQDGAVVDHAEVGGGADGTTYNVAIGVDCPPGANVTLNAVNLHHTSDAIRKDGGLTLTASYIHDLIIDQVAGVHSDVIQATNSGNKLPTLIDNNTLTGGTNVIVFAEQDSGVYTITRNHFIADQTRGNQTSYGVALYQADKASTVSNNTFSSGFQVAPILNNVGASIGANFTENGSALK